jgi:hypothetical protein
MRNKERRRYRQDGQYNGSGAVETKREGRQDYKLDKIEAKTEKAKATATKRKWTALLLLFGLLAAGAFSMKGCLPL